MMRWRPARAAAHRLFSAEFARKDGQPRKKISRLGVGQPLQLYPNRTLGPLMLIWIN